MKMKKNKSNSMDFLKENVKWLWKIAKKKEKGDLIENPWMDILINFDKYKHIKMNVVHDNGKMKRLKLPKRK